MLHLRLAVLAAALSLAGTAPVFAQTAPSQLDRIEQKLSLGPLFAVNRQM
jgi:hypothetical protein